MNTAAIYARSSKDRSDISIQTQVHELTALASSRSLRVVRTFEDAVESGASDDRPAFAELVATIKAAKRGWDVLLVYDTSRIARRRYIAQAFKHLAKKAGVQILYAKLPADLDPVAEVVLESVFEAMDEAHSLMSRDKALAGMRENIRRGWRAGGRAPLGYVLERVPTGAIREGKPVYKTRLQPSDAAETVTAYLQRRARGEPRAAVLRALGTDWRKSTLVEVERRALMYAGHLVWNQRKDNKRLPREQWVIQRDAHPPLITEAEAEAVMAQVDWAAGEKVSAGKRSMSSALLTGLLWAPDGRPWRSAGDQYRLDGTPSKKIRRVVLEEAVVGAVMRDIETEGFLAGLIAASRAQMEESTRAKLIRRDLATARRALEQAARRSLESDDPMYVELVRENRRRINALERDLESSAEDDRVTAQLRNLTPAQLRQIIEAAAPERVALSLVGRIMLGPDLTGTIEYRQVGDVSVASPRGFDRYVPVLTVPFRLAA